MAEITYDLLKNNKAFQRIPILTIDEHWYKLVPEKEKTEKIRLLEDQLNELVRRQGQVNNDIKEVKKIKKKMIQNVVASMESDGVSDAKHQKKMTESQRLIQESKEKIAALEDESMEIPRRIAEANLMLLAETANYCYSTINTNKHDLEVLDKWIADTRVKLKKNLLIKQDKEIRNQNIYTLLHAILGPEAMGALDRDNEQQAQKD